MADDPPSFNLMKKFEFELKINFHGGGWGWVAGEIENKANLSFN